MGRLRDDYENPLFQGVTEEVVDLFGIDDVILYRFATADQTGVTDPLWDEPSTVARFKEYKIKAMFLGYSEDESATEDGFENNITDTIYVALNHLIKAGVPQDARGDYMAPGDVIRIHYKGNALEYDITSADKTGWVNDSDKFTGYDCDVARRGKYMPERKTKP